MDFLFLLSEFDVVSYDMLFRIAGDDDFYKKKIQEFFTCAILEDSGVNKEYIRLNNPIKDYLQRSGIGVNLDFQRNLNNHIENFVKNYQFEEMEMPDFLFSIKESFKQGKQVDYKYLIPSQFLRIMIELYDKKKDYSSVVSFADRALENEFYMDQRIVYEIRYFLCMSLAKLKDRRLFKEVQKVNGPDHNFLLAYYHRQKGRYDLALGELLKSLEQRKNFSRAKRELVQVYIGLEEYGKAKELAKQHYENDKTNPYHIQAYFTCVLKADKNPLNKDILLQLLSEFEKAQKINEKAQEMLLRSKAQYTAFYENKEQMALMWINEAINLDKGLIYPKIAKFEICERFDNIAGMEEVLFEIDSKVKSGYSYNANMFIQLRTVLLAKTEGINKALQYIDSNSKYLNENDTSRIIQRISKYDENNVSDIARTV